jgi:hypothetical protein
MSPCVPFGLLPIQTGFVPRRSDEDRRMTSNPAETTQRKPLSSCSAEDFSPTRTTAYCRNLTGSSLLHFVGDRSIPNRHMTKMRGMVGQIPRRAHSREFLEIVNQMCLVEVSAGERNVRPFCGSCPGDEPQGLLEPPDTAEQFRRHADFTGEHLDEASPA